MGLTYFENIKKLKAYLVQDEQSGYKGIYRMYLGNERIYPNAGTVTYHVDTNVTYTEEVDIDESILNPSTFTPSKSGWTFVGWRKDTTASGSVISDEVMTGDDVTLYAVFRQTITLSYNGNGSTGGSTASQSGARYYNNGNISNPSFVLRSNGFSKSYYNFVDWAMGSTSGTRYDAGESVSLSTSTVFYAMWQAAYTEATATHNGAGIRVGADGHVVIGSGSYGGIYSTPDTINAKTLNGNAISWNYGDNRGTIKANCPCTVSVRCVLSAKPADGWTWYAYSAKLYKNNAENQSVWNGGKEGNADTPITEYTNTVSVSLNAGDTCEIRLGGGHDQDTGDRTQWYWGITYTATPTI